MRWRETSNRTLAQLNQHTTIHSSSLFENGRADECWLLKSNAPQGNSPAFLCELVNKGRAAVPAENSPAIPSTQTPIDCWPASAAINGFVCWWAGMELMKLIGLSSSLFVGYGRQQAANAPQRRKRTKTRNQSMNQWNESNKAKSVKSINSTWINWWMEFDLIKWNGTIDGLNWIDWTAPQAAPQRGKLFIPSFLSAMRRKEEVRLVCFFSFIVFFKLWARNSNSQVNLWGAPLCFVMPHEFNQIKQVNLISFIAFFLNFSCALAPQSEDEPHNWILLLFRRGPTQTEEEESFNLRKH